MRQGISRRRFLRDAAALGAAGALGAGGGRAGAAGRGPQGRQTAAIFGGGMAGLTAAHELAERGFSVDVYEPKAILGGKARSLPVPGTGKGGRDDLPGEHGFRFFPGFYQHVPDTMRRIPDGSNPNGVYDNLRATQQTSFSRSGGRSDLIIPPLPQPWSVAQMEEAIIAAFEHVVRIPPQELAYFARQLVVYMTSSDERRFGQWEYTSWWDFINAGNFSPEYQRMLAIGVTRNLVAAKAEEASTRTIGAMAEAFLYTHMRSGSREAPARLLDAPTNEAWIDPWAALLRRFGVRFHSGRSVVGLELRGGRITAARVRGPRGVEPVRADWFLCAMPVERATPLWTSEILRADPRLARTRALHTDWMNGIQFYLRERVPIVRGHLSYVDSPFALTSISQAQFWHERDLPRDYGDGRIRDILSVDISNWFEPGILYRKPASRLRPPQIAREVWEQIKAHVNDTGRPVLRDEVLVSWFLDPAITYPNGGGPAGDVRAANGEPLLINTIGSWRNRPNPATRIPNLLLAADYVRTNIDLATMEGANESAREAVNTLLRRTGSRAEPARKYTLYRPPEFEPLKRVDAERYRRGERHVLQTPWPSLPRA